MPELTEQQSRTLARLRRATVWIESDRDKQWIWLAALSPTGYMMTDTLPRQELEDLLKAGIVDCSVQQRLEPGYMHGDDDKPVEVTKRYWRVSGGLSKRKTGFALVSPERRRELGSKGGKVTCTDGEHMSQIGHIGGTNVSQDRGHMSRIGKRGGIASAKVRKPAAPSERDV